MNLKAHDFLQLEKKLRIKNAQGLHTRPATYIVRLLQNTKSEVFFSYKDFTINAKSILSLLMLAARKNTLIKVTVKGVDAAEILEKLTHAFDTQFGE